MKLAWTLFIQGVHSDCVLFPKWTVQAVISFPRKWPHIRNEKVYHRSDWKIIPSCYETHEKRCNRGKVVMSKVFFHTWIHEKPIDEVWGSAIELSEVWDLLVAYLVIKVLRWPEHVCAAWSTDGDPEERTDWTSSTGVGDCTILPLLSRPLPRPGMTPMHYILCNVCYWNCSTVGLRNNSSTEFINQSLMTISSCCINHPLGCSPWARPKCDVTIMTSPFIHTEQGVEVATEHAQSVINFHRGCSTAAFPVKKPF